MSFIHLSNFSSIIKKISITSKCKDNKKLEIITTCKKINKNNIIKILENQYNFISNDKNIDFQLVKVNSLNYKGVGKIKRNQYIKNNSIIFHIYERYTRYKKFIITFSNFRDKMCFVDTIESFK